MSAKHDDDDNKKKVEKLPEKVFVARNSLLTDLFENKHIQTIYHVFGAIMVGLFFNTIFYDYLKHQRLHFGFRLIIKGFGNLHVAIALWIFLFLVVCSKYVCFGVWAKIRVKLPPKSPLLKFWDASWLSVLVVYYIYSYYWVLLSPAKFSLPPCSACCIVTEYTRLLMKVHSYVRTNAPKVLKCTVDKKGECQHTPEFSRFAYFLFAPTLIYRDEYPRTNSIRWKFILVNTSEITLTILYLSFIIERFLIPTYEDFCLKKYHWTDIFLSFFANAFAGILFLLIMFYCILHATQNIFAEMLRFADREFYSDWWTSTTLPRYYRTWNIIVHDWLYAYIFKDFVMMGKSRFFAKFMVFFISALVHEIMLTSILGIFCPILFVEFISIGLIFYFIRGPKHGISNILMLYGIAQGTGILLSVYCVEFYARYNSPKESKNVWDFFTIKSLECDSLV